jgi:hypothetical protein
MKNYRNKEVILINSTTKEQVHIGDKVTTFRGEVHTLRSMNPPHKSSSTGRANNFFPSVYNLEFKEL